MGIIMCKKHGRHQLVFLSEGLYNLIENQRTIRKIYKLTLEFEDEIKDVFFMDVENFKSTTRVNLFANLIAEQEKVRPMCHQCFQDFIKESSVTIIDKVYFLGAF